MACSGVKRVWVPPKVAPALWKQSGLREGKKKIWTIWQSSWLVVQAGLSGDEAPEEQSKMLVALVTIEVMMVRLILYNCP